jgi:putative endonuclease
MDGRSYYVYILTCKSNRVLYVGMTNNLIRRVRQHRCKAHDGFTSRYNVNRLIYYEALDSEAAAEAREKQLKGGNRKNKEELINKFNPPRMDLYGSIKGMEVFITCV